MFRLAGVFAVLLVSAVTVALVASMAATPVGGTTSTTFTTHPSLGTLVANFSIGPTQPVCYANATQGPAPQAYQVQVIVTDSSGRGMVYAPGWVSNGCSVTSAVDTNLAAGVYSINLSSCNWLGCKQALPRSFVITAGQTTSVQVSIDTGIR